MKSKKSYINLTVMLDNLKRFWPLWLAYTAIMSLISVFNYYVNVSNTKNQLAKDIIDRRDYIYFVRCSTVKASKLLTDPIFTGAVALVVAILVFSYIFKKRSSYMIHSLPVSRKCLFITNYVSGIIMLLVPMVFVYVTMLGIQKYIGIGMSGFVAGCLLESVIEILFFYSMAVCAVMVCGNGIMTVVVYGVANILYAGIVTMFTMLFAITSYGYDVLMSPFTTDKTVQIFTPVIFFLKNVGEEGKVISMDLVTGIIRNYMYGPNYVKYQGFNSAGMKACLWWIIPVIIFTGLSFYLYLKRDMGRVGERVAFRWCKPVFKSVFTIAGSLAVSTLFIFIRYSSYTYVANYRKVFAAVLVLLAITAIIGYAISEMILKKTFRVWNKRFAISCGIWILIMPLGFFVFRAALESSYKPSASKTKTVSVYVGGNHKNFVYTDKSEIEELIKLQDEIAANPPEYRDDFKEANVEYLDIEYRGDDYDRSYSYTIPVGDEKKDNASYKAYKAFVDYNVNNDKAFEHLGLVDYDKIEDMNMDIYVDEDAYKVDAKKVNIEENMKQVYEAMLQDVKDGNMDVLRMVGSYNQEDEDTRYIDVFVSYKINDKNLTAGVYENFTNDIMIDDKCVNTMKVLLDLGVITKK